MLQLGRSLHIVALARSARLCTRSLCRRCSDPPRSVQTPGDWIESRGAMLRPFLCARTRLITGVVRHMTSEQGAVGVLPILLPHSLTSVQRCVSMSKPNVCNARSTFPSHCESFLSTAIRCGCGSSSNRCKISRGSVAGLWRLPPSLTISGQVSITDRISSSDHIVAYR